MSDPREAIRRYFACFRSKDLETLRGLLAPGLVHTSPWARYEGRDAMLEEVWPQVSGEVWTEDLEIFGDGPGYLVRYRHGGRSTAHLAEYFRFDGARIAEIEVYCGRGALPGAPEAG